MSKPMTAAQFVAALERWKVPHKVHQGWDTHNRNGHGAWGPVHGILLHHTGDDAPDDADYRVLRNGRPDLPGPLCQWGMRDDGTVDLVGWGRANHAGRGAQNVLDAVVAETYGEHPPRPGVDAVDGNAHFYGQETMYSGSRPPTKAAYESTVKVFAAICAHHGWTAKSCLGHKEWTRRKPDPGNLDMAQFRRDVQAAIDTAP